MRGFALLLALFATAASAQQTVEIGGVEYATGLIRKPTAPRDFAPALQTPSDLPESYDAVEDGFVTEVKSQGSCGSCWAFARTVALEAAAIIAGEGTAETLDLAEQDTLVNDRNSYGCNGGFMDGRFEVEKGVSSEALCPYRASGRYPCRGAKAAKATLWKMLGTSRRAPTVDELRTAIYRYGALAVTVAAGSGFSPGRDGRITSCGSRSINHMVALVGYRPASGGGYEFKIKNSWGKSWGVGGYAYSKQGCNKLASSAGDAALYITME